MVIDQSSMLRFSKCGGYSGGYLSGPVEFCLADLPAEKREPIIQDLNKLKNPFKRKEHSEIVGDFTYCIEVREDTSKRLCTIFKGQSFNPSPKVVHEIEELLYEMKVLP